jgi:hypothetical protein
VPTCTSHFIKKEAPYKHNEDNITSSLTVRLPNSATIKSNGTGKLLLPNLNKAAKKVHAFQDLNESLMYVGQLFDAGYKVHFDSDKGTVNGKEKKSASVKPEQGSEKVHAFQDLNESLMYVGQLCDA